MKTLKSFGIRRLRSNEKIRETDGQYVKGDEPGDADFVMSVNPSSSQIGRTVASVQPYGNHFYRRIS